MAKNRILGIEYAGDRLKIVEVSFGRKLKIHNFAIVDERNVDPARRTEQLNHTLQTRGFEARDAIVATSGGATEHRLLTLPPLSAREMHFVMQRESKKLAPTGMNEMLWSYDVLKSKEELGIKKNQILLVTAERPMVDKAQNLLNQTKLKLQQVTTIPEAVMNLLRQVTAWKKDAVRTIVHFAGTGVHVMFGQDGALLLSREIHFDPSEMQQEEQIDRMGNELKRSMLYFRQNYPQAQLDQVVFSGDSDLLGTLSTQAPELLGLPGGVLKFEDSLDTSGFRGNWDEFRFHLPSLAAAMGAAWRKTPGVSGINLIPGKTAAKEQAGINPTKIARVACAAGLAGLLITGGYYVHERGALDASRRDLTQRMSIADPKLQQIQQFETERTVAGQRIGLLKRINTHTDWTEILRSISFVVPQTALFDNVRIESGDPLKLTISGSISAMSAAQGNADFNRFFTDVGSLPFFKTVSLGRPTSVSSIDAPAASNVNNIAAPRSKVTFEIVCELQ
ncbi:MAG TPA: pilus assembly protein PilM [Terriglobia bacterium]|nr:pilus assembly protein PilM [Terriglobia bacterium]